MKLRRLRKRWQLALGRKWLRFRILSNGAPYVIGAGAARMRYPYLQVPR